MGTKVSNYNVMICTDHVTTDPKEIERILKRVSEIVSDSYKRRMFERNAS